MPCPQALSLLTCSTQCRCHTTQCARQAPLAPVTVAAKQKGRVCKDEDACNAEEATSKSLHAQGLTQQQAGHQGCHRGPHLCDGDCIAQGQGKECHIAACDVSWADEKELPFSGYNSSCQAIIVGASVYWLAALPHGGNRLVAHNQPTQQNNKPPHITEQ